MLQLSRRPASPPPPATGEQAMRSAAPAAPLLRDAPPLPFSAAAPCPPPLLYSLLPAAPRSNCRAAPTPRSSAPPAATTCRAPLRLRPAVLPPSTARRALVLRPPLDDAVEQAGWPAARRGRPAYDSRHGPRRRMASSRPSPPCPSSRPAGGAAEVAEERHDMQQ
jgi:hypothetical protein